MLAAKAPASTSVAFFRQNGIRSLRQPGRRRARERLQLPRNLDGDTRATLRAAGVKHAATTDGFHANPKSMCLLATCDGRLVSAFHNYSLLIDACGKY